MTEPVRPRAVGLNHIALEVGDIEEALAFYGRLFRFELRGKSYRVTSLVGQSAPIGYLEQRLRASLAALGLRGVSGLDWLESSACPSMCSVSLKSY